MATTNYQPQIQEKLHNLVSEFRTNFLTNFEKDLRGYYQDLQEKHKWEDVCKQIDEGYKKARKERKYFEGTPEYTRLRKLCNILYEIKNGRLEKMIQREVSSLEKNLLSKEQKLAQRLADKGFTPAFELHFSCYDPNLQGFVTEGDKSVKVWTIIAEGCIQRAHYRYLIK